MTKSEAWDDLGAHEIDPKHEEIKRRVELESRVSTARAEALKILDLRDSAVMDPRNRDYDHRAERVMTLRMIQSTGYPVVDHYPQMSDAQLECYLIRVTQEIRTGKVGFFS